MLLERFSEESDLWPPSTRSVEDNFVQFRECLRSIPGLRGSTFPIDPKCGYKFVLLTANGGQSVSEDSWRILFKAIPFSAVISLDENESTETPVFLGKPVISVSSKGASVTGGPRIFVNFSKRRIRESNFEKIIPTLEVGAREPVIYISVLGNIPNHLEFVRWTTNIIVPGISGFRTKFIFTLSSLPLGNYDAGLEDDQADPIVERNLDALFQYFSIQPSPTGSITIRTSVGDQEIPENLLESLKVSGLDLIFPIQQDGRGASLLDPIPPNEVKEEAILLDFIEGRTVAPFYFLQKGIISEREILDVIYRNVMECLVSANLSEKNPLYISAPPFSGTTTIARQLSLKTSHKYPSIYYFSPSEEFFWENVLPSLQQFRKIVRGPIVFVIDGVLRSMMTSIIRGLPNVFLISVCRERSTEQPGVSKSGKKISRFRVQQTLLPPEIPRVMATFERCGLKAKTQTNVTFRHLCHLLMERGNFQGHRSLHNFVVENFWGSILKRQLLLYTALLSKYLPERVGMDISSFPLDNASEFLPTIGAAVDAFLRREPSGFRFALPPLEDAVLSFYYRNPSITWDREDVPEEELQDMIDSWKRCEKEWSVKPEQLQELAKKLFEGLLKGVEESASSPELLIKMFFSVSGTLPPIYEDLPKTFSVNQLNFVKNRHRDSYINICYVVFLQGTSQKLAVDAVDSLDSTDCVPRQSHIIAVILGEHGMNTRNQTLVEKAQRILKGLLSVTTTKTPEYAATFLKRLENWLQPQ